MLYGRVGSLLEVGTGFNQELTGRENIFLNGAILGMTRAEIRQQFDAIVEFAGVERFLDTPVKHYSSGMYVRLAFAVAAHLQSEILIVDEVLAVGDQEFQRKCLGKMRDVATDGRTVVLVSHNMAAITSLVHARRRVERRPATYAGDVDDAVAEYSSREGAALVGDVQNRRDRRGGGEIRCTKIALRDARGELTRSVRANQPFEVVVNYEAKLDVRDVALSLDVELLDGTRLSRSTAHSATRPFRSPQAPVAFHVTWRACPCGRTRTRSTYSSARVMASLTTWTAPCPSRWPPATCSAPAACPSDRKGRSWEISIGRCPSARSPTTLRRCALPSSIGVRGA